MNTTVKFPLAKMLKDKKFKEKTILHYDLGENYMQFDVDIWRIEGEKGCVLYGIELPQFKTPTAAYEAAIQYALTNINLVGIK